MFYSLAFPNPHLSIKLNHAACLLFYLYFFDPCRKVDLKYSCNNVSSQRKTEETYLIFS